jgi:hypothetical protein
MFFYETYFSILRWIVPDNWTIFCYFYDCKRDNEKRKMYAAYIDPRKASYEIDMRYLIHSIVVIVLGAGAFSVDSIIGLR